VKRTSLVIVIALMALTLLTAAGSPLPAQAGRQPALNTTDAMAGHVGKLTMLRVHDVGTGYGNPNMDIEVVLRLDSEPNNAYGFQLRDDANRLVRQGMLDLLRDAFDNNWTVTINENNGVVFRVWLTK